VLIFAFAAKAQQSHFVYLQTDNGKPFYVKMDNKILSSSSEGYIIIPDITNGNYRLKIGIPKKEYPEEAFSIAVNNQNEGYLIKHFDGKGLQLFNMETLALISGDSDSASQMVASTSTDNNPFTMMLANVVKDSTILQNHQIVIENPTKAADTATQVNNQLTDNIVPNSPDTNAVVQHAIADNDIVSSTTSKPADSEATNSGNISSASLSADSAVAASGSPAPKLLSKQDQDGLQMVYSDKKDTVRVFMPSEENQSTADSKATKNDNFDFTGSNNSANTSPDTSLTITPTVVKPENKKSGFVLRKDTIATATDSAGMAKTAPEQVFYIGPKDKSKNIDTSDKGSSDEKHGLFSGLSKNTKKEPAEIAKPAENKIEVLPSEATPSKTNSDCKAFADNEDFLRLRKKMASEDNKEDMIKVANKFFRSRCFSTGQIKDLSYLFLTDEGKYKFFDAAYAHTSDSDLFATLESQLKDPYYKKRFEALIGK
jgi:hypothetical protein